MQKRWINYQNIWQLIFFWPTNRSIDSNVDVLTVPWPLYQSVGYLFFGPQLTISFINVRNLWQIQNSNDQIITNKKYFCLKYDENDFWNNKTIFLSIVCEWINRCHVTFSSCLCLTSLAWKSSASPVKSSRTSQVHHVETPRRSSGSVAWNSLF